MDWSAERKLVLVPFDFSDPSVEALEAAKTLVSSEEKLAVLHVIYPPSANSPTVIWGALDDEKALARAQEHLKEEVHKIAPGAASHVAMGDPGDSIVHVAKKLDADMIVIPSHGRRGFQRWLLGSVTERVVRLAECPVLVLRRPRTDAEE